MRARVLIGFATAIAVAGVLTGSAGARQNGPKIAFTSSRGGWAPYSVNSDGTAEQRLTSTVRPAFEGEPDWSPDGTRLAYVCGNYGLCVMNADGSAQTQIVQAPWPTTFTYYFDPAWSPDGTRIAFSSNVGGRYDIWAVNADGTGLAHIGGTTGDDVGPSWSPNGQQLVFASGTTGNGDLYVVNADGTGLRKLTATSAADNDPDWSPDGIRIAFTRYNGSQSDLYTINADGSGLRRLTKSSFEEVSPAWSPDGTQLLFAADPGANWDIYVSSLPGRRRITQHPGLDGQPDWQPGAALRPVAPRGRAAPPSEPTDDARVVAAFTQWNLQEEADIEDLDSSSLAVSLRSATALRKDAGRAKRAVTALRPQSARGQRVRRLAIKSFADAQAFARQFEAVDILLMRHKRRAAGNHLLRAAFIALSWIDDSSAVHSATGLP